MSSGQRKTSLRISSGGRIRLLSRQLGLFPLFFLFLSVALTSPKNDSPEEIFAVVVVVVVVAVVVLAEQISSGHHSSRCLHADDEEVEAEA